MIVLEADPSLLRETQAHDAIIVGAGAAGELAAALLTEHGLRVLVLDAGPTPSQRRSPLPGLVGGLVHQLSSEGSLRFLPSAFRSNAARLLGRWRQPVQSKCNVWELAPELFVDDIDCPYVTPTDRPYIWVRARTLGGRLVVPGHARQYYRMAPRDFNPSDGLSVAWPFSPDELEPWYALVERKLGLSGMYDDLDWLPNSEIAQVLSPTLAESDLCRKIMARWAGAQAILGRYAPPINGLAAATQTGRLQCRQGAIVRDIPVEKSGKVSGVSWIDYETRSEHRSSAPVVFLCASALESTRLLMLSRRSDGAPGLGRQSDALGRYLMDHIVVDAKGWGPPIPYEPKPAQGRCIYLPRFDQRSQELGQERGYGVQVYQLPFGWRRTYFAAVAFGEMLPRKDNRVTLDLGRRDAWGIPVLKIDCSHNETDLSLGRSQSQALREIADELGVTLFELDAVPRPPGSALHECGTARMGTAPDNSVVDPNNECWDARGLYVVDAACFPSQPPQNPTLTILALTARACGHALSRTVH
jgi:choline dehydrogenase-like flavoprotein